MAAANFTPSVQQILGIEGGVSDRPLSADPGGLTNKGITQKLYDRWRERRDLPAKSVREITTQEAVAIAKSEFWDLVQGDRLPKGVDFAVFDFAFNSSVAQAVKELQRVLGVTVDGIVGLATLNAVSQANTDDVINRYCDRRWAYMRRLKNFKANENGWRNRVAHVRAEALAMAAGDKPAHPPQALTEMAIAKAPPPQPTSAKKSATVWGAIATPFLIALAYLKDIVTSVPDFVRHAMPVVAEFADRSPWAAGLVNALGFAGAATSAYVAWSVIRAKKRGDH